MEAEPLQPLSYAIPGKPFRAWTNATLAAAAEHWPGFHEAAPETREVSSTSSPRPGRCRIYGNVPQHRAPAGRGCELGDCSWFSCLFPPERKTSRPPFCSLANPKI